MCLPCWKVTGGAFAVFGCFGRSKCCGLIGLDAVVALVAPAALPTSAGLPTSIGLPVVVGFPVVVGLAAPVGLPRSAGLPTVFPVGCETCPAGAPFFLPCSFFSGGGCAPATHASTRQQINTTNILIRFFLLSALTFRGSHLFNVGALAFGCLAQVKKFWLRTSYA